jgi:hypothetical protein
MSVLAPAPPVPPPVALPVSLPVAPLRTPSSTAQLLLARRFGRVVGGGVLALAPVIVVGQRIATAALHEANAADGARNPWSAALLLLLLWPAALVAAAVARRVVSSSLGAVWFDADAFAGAGVVVPAVGVAIAGPLSLHALVAAPWWLVAAACGDDAVARSFDAWIALSLVGTTHVHVAFALLMGIAADRLAQGDDVRRVTLWPAVLVACVPGVLLLFPPALVWLTGLAVSQAFLRLARRWVAADEALAAR